MKWKNIDAGAGYYYITSTITEWLPLLEREDIRRAVIYEIKLSLTRCKGSMCAYVIMRDHLHMLVHLPEDGRLHDFLKLWRGRSGRRVIDILQRQNDVSALAVLARHANGGSNYAAWKEQARSFSVVTEATLRQKMDYIHANPVRAGLVTAPGDWALSSYRYYEFGELVDFAIKPPE